MHRAVNILVSGATVHPTKIAVKSQDLGKQISCKRVAQQILRQRNKRFAFAVCGVLLAQLSLLAASGNDFDGVKA